MAGRDAKGRFLPKGSTPPSAPPLTGGGGSQTRVIDKGWRAWAAWFTAQKRGGSVEVGIFAPDVAEYAAANEFGTARIPERSFIRSTFDEETATLTRMMDAAALRAQTMLIPLADALIPAANHLRSSIIRKISSGPPPPNAPSTVAAKGYDAPLVHTGQLQRAITWRTVG